MSKDKEGEKCLNTIINVINLSNREDDRSIIVSAKSSLKSGYRNQTLRGKRHPYRVRQNVKTIVGLVIKTLTISSQSFRLKMRENGRNL